MLGIDGLKTYNRPARQGAASADVALAKRLLVGRDTDFEPERAVAMLNAAAGKDEPDAIAQLATLAANGAWRAKDWGEAISLLVKAADLGSAYAQGQLLVLAGDADLAMSAHLASPSIGRPWARLAASIDRTALFGPVEKINALEAPRIRVVPFFSSRDMCDWLVVKGLGRFQRALMFDGQKSNVLASRTCSDFKFDIVEGDTVICAIRERVAAMTSIPIPCFEPPQIFHYAVGQEIKAHYDSLRLGDQGYGQNSAYRGDRIVTFLLYLNDEYEGGSLEFPKVGFSHRGRKGDGVYFASVNADNSPDRLSLHAARPVVSGEKYILSQWIHDRVFAA